MPAKSKDQWRFVLSQRSKGAAWAQNPDWTPKGRFKRLPEKVKSGKRAKRGKRTRKAGKR